ncbi:MAG TPA: XTP/dITP diphosphatase [Nanoarchaeota archaeon]|nr:XTP/dITP diphosphatase [Nanoarchaeota archaeon]
MEIYFCTGNKHKLKEYKAILEVAGIKVKKVSAKLIEIQANKLEDVAKEKVKTAYEKIKKPVFVEDAGLFIEALNGFPGVYSAYVFKTIGNQGILKLLNGIKNRKAIFKAVIAFVDENHKIHFFKGCCKGKIAYSIRGNFGFGFDPIFIPKGYNKTFAEDVELKNKISHRKRAIEKFVNFLKRKYLSKS